LNGPSGPKYDDPLAFISVDYSISRIYILLLAEQGTSGGPRADVADARNAALSLEMVGLGYPWPPPRKDKAAAEAIKIVGSGRRRRRTKTCKA